MKKGDVVLLFVDEIKSYGEGIVVSVSEEKISTGFLWFKKEVVEKFVFVQYELVRTDRRGNESDIVRIVKRKISEVLLK
jgi:hypothetical protein